MRHVKHISVRTEKARHTHSRNAQFWIVAGLFRIPPKLRFPLWTIPVAKRGARCAVPAVSVRWTTLKSLFCETLLKCLHENTNTNCSPEREIILRSNFDLTRRQQTLCGCSLGCGAFNFTLNKKKVRRAGVWADAPLWRSCGANSPSLSVTLSPSLCLFLSFSSLF